MSWTFGIVTDGTQWDRVKKICHSIRHNTDDWYSEDQIIVVGGLEMPIDLYELDGCLHIPFNEDEKTGWITRKKNIITNIALNQNICYMHDYVSLRPGWFKGFEKFGDNWLTCMTRITNMDGRRFRDWCVIHNNSWMEPPIDNETPPAGPGRLLNYDDIAAGRWQYYSGAYFCAKKEVMKAIPLDEERTWGQGEDVQWSRLLYQKYGNDAFSMNVEPEARFLKNKQRAPWE